MKLTSTIGLMSSRGARPRSPSRAKAPSPAKRVPPANGLSQNELLAKIDSLDWEPSIIPGSTVVGVMPKSGSPGTVLKSSRHGHSVWPIAGGVVLLGVAALLYQGWTPAPVPVPAVAVESARPKEIAPSEAERSAALAAAAAAEEKRAAMYAKAVEQSERKARRQAEQERLAKAEKMRAEQERRRQEEARVLAEQEAAARAAKAAETTPVVKGPSSPTELCASEKNVFSRGFCEGRVCGKPEWRNHPYCVKRMEEQLNRVSGGGG